jgi:3,4-dihydroxy 2-butanone 4-phosphate synthase/GTP cyclohydrolase II
LASALKNIEAQGRGLVLYMHQEGRGIGLKNKIKAYRLQEQGMDTVEANIALGFAPDMRDYNAAAQVLNLLGIESLNLMTNNPSKISKLESYGIKVSKRIPIEAELHAANKFYMQTKRDKMGHLLEKI